MKTAIGKKIGMTQVFTEEGVVFPVTLVEIFQHVIIGKREKEKDGYDATLFGFGVRSEKKINKPLKGNMGGGAFQGIRETRSEVAGSAKDFAVGDVVCIRGVSKGKGFAGVVKRHGFAGAPKTHGTKHTHRAPGSIGGGLRTRVPKGMRMAGHKGGRRVCVKGLSIVRINVEKNILFVRGSVPGVAESTVRVECV